MKAASDKIDIGTVEDRGGILTIRGGSARCDWHGIHYKRGMSGKNVGTTGLSANIATIRQGLFPRHALSTANVRATNCFDREFCLPYICLP